MLLESSVNNKSLGISCIWELNQLLFSIDSAVSYIHCRSAWPEVKILTWFHKKSRLKISKSEIVGSIRSAKKRQAITCIELWRELYMYVCILVKLRNQSRSTCSANQYLIESNMFTIIWCVYTLVSNYIVLHSMYFLKHNRTTDTFVLVCTLVPPVIWDRKITSINKYENMGVFELTTFMVKFKFLALSGTAELF
jgi:hypothetical protein